jgi:two-component system, NarL family, nitrate/nitrite response regulator NarL
VHALAQMSSLQIVGASDLSVMLRQIAALAPDVALVDFTLAGGLEFSAALGREMSSVKIVALGVEETGDTILACARAGVSGFVTPEGSAADVAAAVHSAVRGELLCSPRIAGALLSQLSALSVRPATVHDDEMLTPREREIIVLIRQGHSNKEIARATGIQNATVKNHVHSILSKLRLRRRGEVAALWQSIDISLPEAFVMPALPLPAAPVKNQNAQGLSHPV